MSNYTLNGKSMTAEYGFIAGRADGNLALKGAWDMPERMGKTYHDWGTEKGIEPYVLPAEIRHAGRSITLNGYIKGTGEKDCLTKANKLYTDIDQYTALVPLVSDKFGSWNVLVNGEITHTYRGSGLGFLSISFKEPIVNLQGIIPVNTDATDFGIDGISFARLGLRIISMDSRGNRPAPKAGSVTAYQSEGYRITKSGSREISIRAFYSKPTYADFLAGIQSLYALFAKPGLRYILKPNDMLRDFFVTKGFTLSRVSNTPGLAYAFLDMTIIEVGAYGAYEYLTDDFDQLLLDSTSNKIIKAK